jgi:hypothetical protein
MSSYEIQYKRKKDVEVIENCYFEASIFGENHAA